MDNLTKGSMEHLLRVEEIENKIKANPDKKPEEFLTEDERGFYSQCVLLSWSESKEALEKAKADEMELRVKYVKFAFDPDVKKGTAYVDLGGGYRSKAVKSINYGWVKTFEGKTNKQAIDAALDKIEASGEVGKFIADKLVKWTPELSVSTYNELEPKFKAIIDEVIVTSDGAPTLEIVAPKGKK